MGESSQVNHFSFLFEFLIGITIRIGQWSTHEMELLRYNMAQFLKVWWQILTQCRALTRWMEQYILLTLTCWLKLIWSVNYQHEKINYVISSIDIIAGILAVTWFTLKVSLLKITFLSTPVLSLKYPWFVDSEDVWAT